MWFISHMKQKCKIVKNFIMKDFTFVKYCTMKIKCKNVKFWTMKDFTLVNNFTMKKFTLVKYWIYETKNVRLWNISHMKTLPTVTGENAYNWKRFQIKALSLWFFSQRLWIFSLENPQKMPCEKFHRRKRFHCVFFHKL